MRGLALRLHCHAVHRSRPQSSEILMGKTTISMAIFNSFKLPNYIPGPSHRTGLCLSCCRGEYFLQLGAGAGHGETPQKGFGHDPLGPLGQDFSALRGFKGANMWKKCGKNGDKM